ncbi:MAG: hypothetical protein KGZ32_04905, partial [Dethiobacter sp.]|nr:hypothetical protein [Dethiobacter sp.]
MPQWYKLDVTETLHSLQSCREGLTAQEAEQRLKRYGLNE